MDREKAVREDRYVIGGKARESEKGIDTQSDKK